jgi:hypothetical protein
MTNPAPPALYLRTDGSLLFVRGDAAIELRLTPQQLLQLACDALQVAVSLDPAAEPAAAELLSSVVVPPGLVNAAARALADSTATSEAPCHKLN